MYVWNNLGSSSYKLAYLGMIIFCSRTSMSCNVGPEEAQSSHC